MFSEQHINEMVKRCNQEGRNKTFAEFIAELFKGKFIEIYLSDSYEEVSTEQISQNYPAVFAGKVVAAYRECLIINSVFVNDAHKMALGNMMFINERAVKSINEIDGNGIMEDMFLRSSETKVIKDIFIDGNPQPTIKKY